MPTVAALLELDNLEARTNALNSQVEENRAKAQLMAQQAKLLGEDAQLQQVTREAAAAAQAAADAANSSVTPESRAELAQQENPVQAAIRESMQTIRQQRTLASQIRRSGGDIKAAEAAERAANVAEQTLFHNMNLAFEQQKDMTKRIGAAAGSALPDGSNLSQVQAALDAINPNWMKGANVDTMEDLFGNQRLVWGKNTDRFLATMAQQAVSAEKQLDARMEELKIQQREREFKAQEEERKLAAERHDQDLRFRQQKLRVDQEEREEARADRREAREDRREARETRAAERAAAREAKGEKAAEPKTPVQAEVRSTAALFEKDPDIQLKPSQAEAAAWDYHRKVNELEAKGTPRAEAEASARQMIKDRVDTKTIEGGWFKSDREEREYNRWKNSAEAKESTEDLGTLREAKELQAVGVGYKQVGDKIQLTSTSKTPPAKAALIAEAQKAIDAGKDRALVLKRLKELMVK